MPTVRCDLIWLTNLQFGYIIETYNKGAAKMEYLIGALIALAVVAVVGFAFYIYCIFNMWIH